MSSKSSIILTNDNEHWYSDCSDPLSESKDAIVLEFNKKNIKILMNDEEDLIISITNPDSEIYEIISMLKK